MKTIFRLTSIGVLLAAVLALGAVAGLAEDPCTDADGQTKLSDDVRTQFVDKTIPGRTKFIETGKQFLDKYGTCDPAKEMSDWLKTNIPKSEDLLKKQIAEKLKQDRVTRFNTALNGKNWDDLYPAGKEILANYPDEYRAVELVLGSIGYDELLDHQNGKYSDQTMSYAKQSLADLEAGKEFKGGYGVGVYTYKSKEDAVAWMNLTIGSIYYLGQKNKEAALPYLYKATQAPASSDVSKNPNPYDFIGNYYFDQLNKLIGQIKDKVAAQSDTDTPDVAQKKVDEIKALVALSNGTAERAMDAFSRAYTLGQKPDYKAKMKQNVADAYKVRFAKTDGVDAWISSAVAKPFVNPTSPIQPISDPEPVKTDATATPTTTTPAAKPGTVIKPTPPPASKPGGKTQVR